MNDRIRRASLGSSLVVLVLATGCQDVALRLGSRRPVDGEAAPSTRGGGGGMGGSGSGTGSAMGTACPDALTLADPDVEAVVRSAAGVPIGPIRQADVATLTNLDLIFANAPACVGPTSTCFDHTTLDSADGWVTSLAGVECIVSLQALSVDAFFLDLAPLAKLPRLSTLTFGPALESDIPLMPQVTSLTMLVGGINTTLLGAFPSLLSLEGEGEEWTPELRSALTAHTNLVSLHLERCSGMGLGAGDLASLTKLTDLSVKSCGLSNIAPLSRLEQLQTLVLSGNQLSDISALSALVNLRDVDLSQTGLRDLTPLVANGGLGSGDTLVLYGVAAACNSQQAVVATLRQRGVTVTTDCP